MHLYGSPVSQPTNKVRYTLQFLEIPYEFHSMNLAAGDQKTPDYLKINPYGRIPAIDDNGFMLSESNAIMRYLASKSQSAIYPVDLHKRAKVDQWIDFATMHVLISIGRIMFNTYFYRFAKSEKDERSLQDGKKFIAQYLPIVDKQLSQSEHIAQQEFTLADIAMLAPFDSCEYCNIDLTSYPNIMKWRTKLMSEPFYQNCKPAYKEVFEKILAKNYS